MLRAALVMQCCCWSRAPSSRLLLWRPQNAWFLPCLVANAVTAWAVNLLNFLVTRQTSALTLQVSWLCCHAHTSAAPQGQAAMLTAAG